MTSLLRQRTPRLHPVILDPVPPETGARIRRALWVTYAVLGYVVVGWALR